MLVTSSCAFTIATIPTALRSPPPKAPTWQEERLISKSKSSKLTTLHLTTPHITSKHSPKALHTQPWHSPPQWDLACVTTPTTWVTTLTTTTTSTPFLIALLRKPTCTGTSPGYMPRISPSGPRMKATLCATDAPGWGKPVCARFCSMYITAVTSHHSRHIK